MLMTRAAITIVSANNMRIVAGLYINNQKHTAIIIALMIVTMKKFLSICCKELNLIAIPVLITIPSSTNLAHMK